MRFRFVAAERAAFPVRALGRVVGASASGFYAWLRRGPGSDRREGVDQGLRARLGAIFAASRGRPPAARGCMPSCARRACLRVGRNRVARLMREGGLVVTRRRRAPRTTDSRHGHPIAPNRLERRFTADRPDAVWLAAISYVPTGEGWLYLAAIKDLATREIPPVPLRGPEGRLRLEHGRSPRGRPLARDALLLAVRRRQPPRGLLHHSDRGVPYASEPSQAVLVRHGLRCSMSRRGNCLDCESVGATWGT